MTILWLAPESFHGLSISIGEEELPSHGGQAVPFLNQMCHKDSHAKEGRTGKDAVNSPNNRFAEIKASSLSKRSIIVAL